MLAHLLSEGRISVWNVSAAGFKHGQWAKEAEEAFKMNEAGEAVFDLHPKSSGARKSAAAKKASGSKAVGADIAPRKMVANKLTGNRPA
jgi:hypothetical protein